jgi:Na+/H+-translocating membrane pyrophosphatase
MVEINQAVKDGAITFLKKEYTALAAFCAVFAIIVLCAVDMPWSHDYKFPYTMFAFLVGLALLILEIMILSYKAALKPDSIEGCEQLFEFISGYGLGGSTVALFGRVGGGIYTKAADVGADLAGKVEASLPEDSPKNPGTIADNVGDNVGDIAGMGADLFGSLAESTCAALIVSATSKSMTETPEAIYFPLVVTAIGIGASFICQFFAYIRTENVET